MKIKILGWCSALAGVGSPDADTLSQLPTFGQDSIYFKDLTLLRKLFPAEKASDSKCGYEECYISGEVFEATAPGLPTVSPTACVNPATKATTTDLAAEQASIGDLGFGA